ncbi:MAG: translation elongation factor Ts [Candidatus Niyogibacteria bacterium CG10_big_fil_rev_8_21_14_0_10_46_36]|uniref:Elongation factor Ts n=1 Tax=Candidatus Niyogibacteria bacterium CG10_big_fil_rev_8_21_14_0_10_46_36 TaxID=1974726 RepID=A0A2H0TD84_9BACT|nr:MAG: translation elongation factor Ts [Candidatus Niyogibacteria bacterium CG10_big_fil_rev_8_21_14_0_10_46_36]
MSNDLETVKQLREETGVSIMACKRALSQSGGDMEKAKEILRKESDAVAIKKTDRETKAGVIDAYIHSNKKVGVLLEVRSETDFVARSPEFEALAHDIAMHIAASTPESVDDLLSQPFIKDMSMTIGDKIKEAIQKFGENIEVAQFERFSL